MTEVRFDGRVAVVTGAGRGLGRAYALLLAARGARVLVNDAGGPVNAIGFADEPAESVAAEIRAAGGSAVANADSVATREGGERIIAAALEAFGRVDTIIHNAGIVGAELESTLAVHLQGAFWVMRPAWPKLLDQGYGRVLLITSGAGLWGFHGAPDVIQHGYGAAKMGLVGLMKNLAFAGRGRGVHVNALAPVALTRMTVNMGERYTRWLEQRFGPEQVAPAAVWLVHEDCPVSGEIFTAGGGRVARVLLEETRGLSTENLTLEQVRDAFDRVMDPAGSRALADADEELSFYGEELGLPLGAR